METKIERVTMQDGSSRLEGEATLPSGLKVRFVAPGPYGWAAIWKSVPSLKKPQGGDSKITEEEADDAMAPSLTTITTFSISPKIVNKAPQDLLDGEISAWLMEDEDVAHLIKAMGEALGYKSPKAEAMKSVLDA